MKFKNYSIVVLYNDKNEIFIQDRTSISKDGEKWGFFGGGVEAGETFEEALVREIMEELNIDISSDYKYFGSTTIELEGFGIQKTNIYLVKYDKKFDNHLKILEGDNGYFINLEKVSNLEGTASWSHICIRMLKEYFNKKK